ncbi:hypothetical protein [Mangrovibacterium lignilyticum]|uniref:hypothetical protein n=1 Tax=Mangrovibacterium lignilyticum TaxID=2668052 RepID=UPI0013D13263|nr:hypothetical protein [Mangrovibacterium lignilyticum]
MRKQVLGILVSFAFGLASFAQEMPEAQKNFIQFEGEWICKNPKMTVGEDQMTGEYTFYCELVNDNTGVVAHEKFVGEDFTMLGENLVGYDPNLNQVHMYSIDNTGTAHDHVGYWTEANSLYVQYQGVVEGKMYVEQIWVNFTGTNTMSVKLHGIHNGKLVENFDAVFQKP